VGNPRIPSSQACGSVQYQVTGNNSIGVSGRLVTNANDLPLHRDTVVRLVGGLTHVYTESATATDVIA
jgi:hypothetical protein